MHARMRTCASGLRRAERRTCSRTAEQEPSHGVVLVTGEADVQSRKAQRKVVCAACRTCVLASVEG